MILNGWKGIQGLHVLQQPGLFYAWCQKISHTRPTFEPISRYPTIIMTKSQLQKHARSLDTSNAWGLTKILASYFYCEYTTLKYIAVVLNTGYQERKAPLTRIALPARPLFLGLARF
jgi:hypothetical protein